MSTTAAFAPQWDTGWMIWLVILIVAAGICWLTAICAGIARAWAVAGGAVVCALVVGAIGTFLAFPFSGQYHRFVPQQGRVAKTGFRFLASDTQGGGSTQKYVITFADGRSFGCMDTRCANVTKGDYLILMCERSFQFNAPVEGWDCNWGRDTKANGSVIP